jgi:hypothetical protein
MSGGDDARAVALSNARSTRWAHKLKSTQWNLYTYGALGGAGAGTLLALSDVPKLVQAAPPAVAVACTAILRSRAELRESCRRHHAAARDIKWATAEFQVSESEITARGFIERVREIDRGAADDPLQPSPAPPTAS